MKPVMTLLFCAFAASTIIAAESNILKCQVHNQESRILLLIFNEAPIERATVAGMFGVTSSPMQYHPVYGSTSLEWNGSEFSATFENNMNVDWENVELIEDRYAYRGGGPKMPRFQAEDRYA